MQKIMIYICLVLAAVCVLPPAATAQFAPIQISSDQKLMFEAAKRFVQRDFQGAEALYSQAITMNSGNIEAWLQRGMARRELGNAAGSAADGRQALALCNNAIAVNPNDPQLYYQRGMSYRLLKDFPHAEQDVASAIRMSGNTSWQTDLTAIEVEEKER